MGVHARRGSPEGSARFAAVGTAPHAVQTPKETWGQSPAALLCLPCRPEEAARGGDWQEHQGAGPLISCTRMERRAEPGSAALQHPLATKANVRPSPSACGCCFPLCCEAHFPYCKGKKAFVVWSSGDVSPARVLPCQSLRQPEIHRDSALRLKEGTWEQLVPAQSQPSLGSPRAGKWPWVFQFLGQ